MRTLLLFLWLAGLVQVAIAGANFLLPQRLNYKENLERVSPIIRQIFFVHSAYIVFVLLLFASISFGFAAELTSGRGLGRFLAAGMMIFWLCRVPLQLFYYDGIVRRSNRAGDLAFTASALFLAATYGAAVFVQSV
jgi:hypothetical protein